jgi:hypothetical protein
MTKIKKFIKEKWLFIVTPIPCAICSVCLVHLFLFPSIIMALASFGCLLSLLWIVLLARTVELNEHKVLKVKIEATNSYADLLEKTKYQLEYFNKYQEPMLENVAIYSQMASRRVEAPVANSIIAFSQEIGSEHTIVLISIDHLNSKWSIRAAGRAIYLSQLRAVWDLAKKYFEDSSKTKGTIIVNKEKSIIN